MSQSKQPDLVAHLQRTIEVQKRINVGLKARIVSLEKELAFAIKEITTLHAMLHAMHTRGKHSKSIMLGNGDLVIPEGVPLTVDSAEFAIHQWRQRKPYSAPALTFSHKETLPTLDTLIANRTFHLAFNLQNGKQFCVEVYGEIAPCVVSRDGERRDFTWPMIWQ